MCGVPVPFIFVSPNVGDKPADQSRSSSVYMVLLQISVACIFVFDEPLKLRVVHTGKILKFVFSQKSLKRN